MKKLIEALTIFLKYADEAHPTICEHDVLCVVGISLHAVSDDDREKLEQLSFHWSDEYDSWISYKYGSA